MVAAIEEELHFVGIEPAGLGGEGLMVGEDEM